METFKTFFKNIFLFDIYDFLKMFMLNNSNIENILSKIYFIKH